MGLLPCPERLHCGHDRAYRSPDRTLRSRLPRPNPREEHDGPGRSPAHQRQPRRRRYKRWATGYGPALHPTCCTSHAVLYSGPRSLPLLLLDPARRRRPWHVRLLRRPRRSRDHAALRSTPGAISPPLGILDVNRTARYRRFQGRVEMSTRCEVPGPAFWRRHGMTEARNGMSSPLEGVRVVETGSLLAG